MQFIRRWVLAPFGILLSIGGSIGLINLPADIRKWLLLFSWIGKHMSLGFPTHSVAIVAIIVGFLLLLASEPGTWLLQFILRLPDKTLIPLREAAIEAYDVMRESKHLDALLFDRTIDSEEQILEVVAYHITSEVPIIGRRPPSKHMRQVDEETRNQIHSITFSKGVASTESTLANRFTDLAVSKKKLAVVIRKIKREAKRDLHKKLQEAH